MTAAVPVVVVTHAGPSRHTRTCLAALLHDGNASPVVVVDNGSIGRGTSPDPSAYGPGPITVIHSANHGFGAAANLGFREARLLASEENGVPPSSVALLNDDIEVTSGWLQPLVRALSETCGAVQPKLLLSSDDAGRDGTRLVNSVGVRLDEFGAGSDIGYGSVDGPAYQSARDIDIFTGGAVLFSTDFIDSTGGFDERYFLYYEDVDLALRGAELGWTFRCEPSSIVHHEAGSTTSELGEDLRRLQDRNRLWVASRFGSPSTLRRAFGLSIRRLRHAPRRGHARALAAGLLAAPGRLVDRRRTPVDGRKVRGVNVVGYHHVVSGLGEASRQMVAAFEAAGIPCIPVDVTTTHSRELRPPAVVPTALHDVTVAVVTARELPGVWSMLPTVREATRHLVGYWFWELSTVPETHAGGIALVDEIWAPTTFVEQAYASSELTADTPISKQPMYVAEPPVSEETVAMWRQRIAPGGEFVFLVSFDFFSIVERKNPFAAIEAFSHAFGDDPERNVRLVIKTINGAVRPDDLRRVATAASADDRINIIDEYVPEEQITALIAAADCLVSLHRSEGLGLHVADAMWIGTPVIATNYSGTADLVDERSALLVDYELVAVEHGGGAYPDDAVWADANVEHAASRMLAIADDPALAEQLIAAACRRMQGQNSRSDLGRRCVAALTASMGATTGAKDTRKS